MKNTERIVGMLRADPKADVTALVDEDASTLTAKVVGTSSIALIRLAVIEFTRTVHAASAAVLRREHSRRVAAELDAAHWRALLDGGNRRLTLASHAFASLRLATPDSPEYLELVETLTKLLRPVEDPRTRR